MDADPWIVNRGSNEQVAVGDQYEIVREGKEIMDDAGIVIGKLKSVVGNARVTQVQETLAVLTLCPGEFAVNDLAILQRATGTAVAPATKAPPVMAAGSAGAAPATGRPRWRSDWSRPVRPRPPAWMPTDIFRCSPIR